MGDIPDDVPSLEELGDGDDLPAYWAENTTITVRRWVKESLDKHREGRPWGQYLEMLRREHADPITFNDVGRMAEVLADELDGDSGDLQGEIQSQLDRIEDAATTAEERTGSIERTLEDVNR